MPTIALHGFGPTFWAYAGVRLVFGVLGLSAAYWIARAPSGAVHDRLVFAWLVVLSAVLIGLDATRPPGFIAGVLIEVLAVVFIYTAIRFPLRLQVIRPDSCPAGPQP